MTYTDIDGNKIDFDRWSELFADHDYRRIGYYARNGVEVSTVWTGMNQEPFETMFSYPDRDATFYRWNNRQAAATAHEELVLLAREYTPSGPDIVFDKNKEDLPDEDF